EWVHVQLHQQKGMISLSPPTICNSAAAFFNIVKKNKHGFLPNHTKDARKAFLNECPDNGEGGSNQSMISQIISKYGKVRL
ncbi:TrbM/KikA/MpfK family conjugal transfer protein, partial [Klebsiella aerogenes]|uniref:TrbM/KikA/MpfK family conjugal transfer protein n=1 Tax=Klebsiella aerogenes TaxID=548 RepID=UPI001F05B4AE